MCVARKITDALEVESTSPPYERPRRTWAGLGSGILCDLCHRPIEEHQIEYEVELPTGAPVPVLNLHLGCYEQWTDSESHPE